MGGSEMSLLVRTPSAYPTESLLGFVLRVAEANGYETPRHIHAVAGVPRERAFSAEFPVEHLSVVLNQAPSRLQSIAYRQKSDPRRALKILNHPLGHDLRRTPLRLFRPNMCPQCISEAGYIDAFWDLIVAVACPRHRRMVVSHCPSCAAPLSWMRPGLLKCACGHSLSEAEHVSADLATVELMAIIYARLHGAPTDTLENSSKLPVQQLISMPFSALIRMLQLLGSYAISTRENSFMQVKSTTSAAANVLSSWPTKYHGFLTELGTEFLKSGRSALELRKQFEPFYAAMFKNTVFSKHCEFLHNEFIRFGYQSWGAAYVDTRLAKPGKAPEPPRFLTAAQAAQTRGLCKPTMHRLIAEGAVVARKLRGNGKERILVDMQASRFPAESNDVLSIREAAELLEIPVSVLKELRRRGAYTVEPHRGRANSYHRGDVESFRARILSLPVRERREQSRTVSFGKLMQLKLKSGAGKADIVAAILAGDVDVISRHNKLIGAIQLDAEQIDRFILDRRCAAQGGTYNLFQCSKATGLDQSTIKGAIKARLIAATSVGGGLRVPRTSVDAFNEEFVPLSVLARKLNTSSRSLHRLCIAHGIVLKTIPRSTSSSAQSLIHRKDEGRLFALWGKTPRARRRNVLPSCTERVRQYLIDLERTGERLPRRAGRPHKSKIAQSCGMSRDRIYKSKAIAMLIAEHDKRERAYAVPMRPINALLHYLKELKQSGESLPLWGKQPNKRLIATSCGFSGREFYRDPKLLQMLNAYHHTESRRPPQT